MVNFERHTKSSVQRAKPDARSDPEMMSMVIAARDAEISELKDRLHAVTQHRDSLLLQIETLRSKGKGSFKVPPKLFVPRDR